MTATTSSKLRPAPDRGRPTPLAGSPHLPWLSTLLCRLLRVIARGTAASLRCGESTWRFRWVLAAQAAVDLGIRIRAGAGELWIGLPRAQAAAFPADAFDARVPPAIRAELLKDAAAPMWALLGQVLGVPVQPLDAGALGAASFCSSMRRDALMFALEEEGGDRRIVGSVKPENAAAVRLLTEASSALIARDATPIDYPIELRLILGTAQLDIAQVRSLETGDSVLLEHRPGPNRGLIAAVRAGSGAHLVALAECEGHSARILEIWLEEVRTMDELATTRHERSKPPPGEHRANENVMALQVPLRFEIGLRRMRLSELCAIRPGEVLELDVAIESATVTILCGSDAIGTGQLVAIGDRLGVRVLALPRPAPAPPSAASAAPSSTHAGAVDGQEHRR